MSNPIATDTVVLAPAGYLLDPDIGSDYERPWRLAEGLAKRGLRVVVVAREVKRRVDLGSNILVEYPPGSLPTTPMGRLIDRVNLYLHARRVARREVSSGRTLVVHHLGPCSEQSPSLVPRLTVPFVYGPMPASRPARITNDEWESWILAPGASRNQLRLSAMAGVPLGRAANVLVRATLRRADAITLEAPTDLIYKSSKVTVIPPGIDEVQFSPSNAETVVAGRVIGVGRLLSRKGYDVLIRAISRVANTFPPTHLVLVGDGPEGKQLRALAQQLGIGSTVTFLGAVPRSELPALLRTAVVFCHPANWDNVPFAPLEAMACGLPTLVSAAGGLPQIVGEAGVVHAVGDEEDLANRLAQILTTPNLQRVLGSAARARVLERFTWQRMSDSYLSLYQRLAETKLKLSRN